MRTRRLALCVATTVLAVASSSAGAAVTTPTKNEPSHGGFRTPSGNIFCNFETAVGDNGGPSRFLYCAIKSGIKPAAPRKAPGVPARGACPRLGGPSLDSTFISSQGFPKRR